MHTSQGVNPYLARMVRVSPAPVKIHLNQGPEMQWQEGAPFGEKQVRLLGLASCGDGGYPGSTHVREKKLKT